MVWSSDQRPKILAAVNEKVAIRLSACCCGSWINVVANHSGRKNMRSLTSCLLLITFVALPGSFVCAQSTEPADKAAASPSGSATKQEVDQLRQEVAGQRQTIELLQALVQQLVDAKTQSVSATAQAAQTPRLLNATLVQGGTTPAAPATAAPHPAYKQEHRPA